jgi:hypothetical protein
LQLPFDEVADLDVRERDRGEFRHPVARDEDPVDRITNAPLLRQMHHGTKGGTVAARVRIVPRDSGGLISGRG